MGDEPGRVMGIDYGTKRIGVAVSDPLRVIARGVGMLENGPDVLERLGGIIREEKVSLIIVGMPFAPDGGEGKKGEEVNRFITSLRSAIDIPVTHWDESYTSVNARRAFIDGGMKKKQRQEKGRVDVMAARLLLQEYLENEHHR